MARKKMIKGMWTKTEITLLKKIFPHSSTAKVAVKLGRPFENVKKKASRMGLRKTKKYLKSLGRT